MKKQGNSLNDSCAAKAIEFQHQNFDTKFYIYPKAPVVLWYNLFNRIKRNGIREYFGSKQGHLYNESLLIDIPCQIRLEAYEVYSYYSKLKKKLRPSKLNLLTWMAKNITKSLPKSIGT